MKDKEEEEDGEMRGEKTGKTRVEGKGDEGERKREGEYVRKGYIQI